MTRDPGDAPTSLESIPPGHPVHAFWALACVVRLLIGFGAGRAGAGVAATAQGYASAEITREQEAAANAEIPKALKYDVFLRTVQTETPIGLTAWGEDNNGHLVLYMDKVTEWRSLTPSQQKAIMGLLAIQYTTYRLRNGMDRTTQAAVQQVLTLARTEGIPLAARQSDGKLMLFRPDGTPLADTAP